MEHVSEPVCTSRRTSRVARCWRAWSAAGTTGGSPRVPVRMAKKSRRLSSCTRAGSMAVSPRCFIAFFVLVRIYAKKHKVCMD